MASAMKQALTHRSLAFLIRIFLGITLLYAAYDKVLHPQVFAEAVANYRILPSFLVALAAATLPWIELFCGLFLVLGLFTRSSSLIVAVLFLIFAMGITSAVVRGIDIDCGCFRVTQAGHNVSTALIFRDIGYLILCLHVMIWDRGFWGLSTLFRRDRDRSLRNRPDIT